MICDSHWSAARADAESKRASSTAGICSKPTTRPIESSSSDSQAGVVWRGTACASSSAGGGCCVEGLSFWLMAIEAQDFDTKDGSLLRRATALAQRLEQHDA